MDSYQLHEMQKRKLQETLRSLLKESKTGAFPIGLRHSHHQSNSTRMKRYNAKCARLDLDSFSHILSIDRDDLSATVEPQVTMYDLALQAYNEGLFVPVVPEFKGITVGGAINGAAGESSSHKYGLFNDICLSYEILLGNGDIIEATPENNADIFYGIAGSYGTLGTILKAKIRLIPRPIAIKITYLPFTRISEGMHCLHELIHTDDEIEYIDGIIFSDELMLVMKGELVYDSQFLDQDRPQAYSATKSKWFYQHAWKIAAREAESIEYLDPIDYLFRYDQGAFWMGSYLFQPQLMRHFLFHTLFQRDEKSSSPFSQKQRKSFEIKMTTGSFLQPIFSKIMSSQMLYRLLHRNETWAEQYCVIQDFCIPVGKALEFYDTVKKTSNIYPLWLCPIRKGSTPQIFSPHATRSADSHYLNFGIYGIPMRESSPQAIIKELECETERLQGRKVLYTHSYYPIEKFWQIYPQDEYQKLRDRYHAEKTWLRIEEKVLRTCDG